MSIAAFATPQGALDSQSSSLVNRINHLASEFCSPPVVFVTRSPSAARAISAAMKIPLISSEQHTLRDIHVLLAMNPPLFVASEVGLLGDCEFRVPFASYGRKFVAMETLRTRGLIPLDFEYFAPVMLSPLLRGSVAFPGVRLAMIDSLPDFVFSASHCGFVDRLPPRGFDLGFRAISLFRQSDLIDLPPLASHKIHFYRDEADLRRLAGVDKKLDENKTKQVAVLANLGKVSIWEAIRILNNQSLEHFMRQDQKYLPEIFRRVNKADLLVPRPRPVHKPPPEIAQPQVRPMPEPGVPMPAGISYVRLFSHSEIPNFLDMLDKAVSTVKSKSNRAVNLQPVKRLTMMAVPTGLLARTRKNPGRGTVSGESLGSLLPSFYLFSCVPNRVLVLYIEIFAIDVNRRPKWRHESYRRQMDSQRKITEE